MKRFTMTTAAAALALSSAPAFADDQATKKVNTASSEQYDQALPMEDEATYRVLDVMGTTVYSNSKGNETPRTDAFTGERYLVGSVEDVVVNSAGILKGVLVDPVGDEDTASLYIPADELIIFSDEGKANYMVQYTSDELSEIERIERPEAGK